MGRIMALAGRLAREQGANDGFRTIVNAGRVGRQDVQHLREYLGHARVTPSLYEASRK